VAIDSSHIKRPSLEDSSQSASGPCLTHTIIQCERPHSTALSNR